jgi:subtilase family serine protease
MPAIQVSPPLRLSSAICSTLIAAVVLTFSLSPSMQGQEPAQSTTMRPLIQQPVDESQLTTLKGNTHPLARSEFDLGTAPSSLPMQRMLLVLKRSPDQETALRTLLDNQQSKTSSSFHKWLTPEQYGQQFGPTNGDMQTVIAWLQSHGFQVGTTKGRSVLEFSGTAGQVQEAFHTTIHKYVVGADQHWANAGDPMIPTALTPAVAGVLTLHNFIKKPAIHFAPEAIPAKVIPGKKRPLVTFPAQNGQPAINALAPEDYATIYNINPLYSNFISGGATISVVGRSNLFNGGQDAQDFRSVFSVCCGLGVQVILNGPDPGDLGGGEEAEATLDSTWSNAIAPDSPVNLIVSATTNTTDGVDLSENYIIEDNSADVMTESFSSCELYATDAQLAGQSAMAEQAAAQGITYFVSTGDEGTEGCDDPSVPPATHPISVNYLASTAFNTAVGGTLFNENGNTSQYWTSAAPFSETAISYIPEDVWNESSLTNGLWSSGGGASAGNILGGLGGTTTGVPKPNWQYGVEGIPEDGVRDLPDVSLTAASHDPYLLCLEGSCVPNSQGEIFVYFVSGTSAAAPSFAGIMALVDTKAGQTNTLLARQGLANYALYRLAATQAAYPSQCNGSNTSAIPPTTCIFNDVTVGNNVVPGEVGTAYQANAGYDLATGLGSVNVANLVNQWSAVTFNPTTDVLTVTPSVIPHGSPVPFTITVTPNSGTGTPTGTVSLAAYTEQETILNMGAWTLSAGSVSSTINSLPGGSTLLVAYYAGDATYAPSPSVASGCFVYLRADVAGASGYGIPTGGVTLFDGGSPIVGGSLLLNSEGNTATPNGIFNFDTGTHTISATYSGDFSFNPSSTTQSQSFTITAGFYGTIPSAQSTLVITAPGASGVSSISVSNSTGFSGTISLACSGLPSEAACQFAPSTITANGTAATTSAAITVTTVAPTTSSQQRAYLPAAWMMGTGLILFSSVLLGGKRQRANVLLLMLTLTLLIVAPSCGGGSSKGGGTQGPPPNAGTPTGTSTVLVTATSGSTTSTTAFTLVVQ